MAILIPILGPVSVLSQFLCQVTRSAQAAVASRKHRFDVQGAPLFSELDAAITQDDFVCNHSCSTPPVFLDRKAGLNIGAPVTTIDYWQRGPSGTAIMAPAPDATNTVKLIPKVSRMAIFVRNFLCVVVLTGSLIMSAQNAPPSPSFEVIDIKSSKLSSPQRAQFLAGGRIEMKGGTATDMVESAFSLSADRIEGAPPWAASDRFDIIAKAAPNYALSQLPKMLEGLLIERFKLATHQGEKVMPVLALVADPKKLKLQASPAADGKPICREVQGEGAPNLRHPACENMSMSDLARYLSGVAGYIDRPVIDKTDISGRYDIRLEFAYYSLYANASPDTAPVTSIFDALAKLGLKLNQEHATMKTLVIDSIEHPALDN
jgi:uncharacterized protein (TIGR03435 family)